MGSLCEHEEVTAHHLKLQNGFESIFPAVYQRIENATFRREKEKKKKIENHNVKITNVNDEQQHLFKYLKLILNRKK